MAIENKHRQTKSSRRVERIFETDEMQLRAISPDWSTEDLLGQEGIFYLKDVVGKLQLSTADFKKKAADLEEAGESAWETMGLRKAWTHWIVRMKKFGEFISVNSMPRIREVDASWDGNTLLSQKGQFYLTDVCDKIPFSSHQIRYQVRQKKNPREEFGVWKDEGYLTYVVEMETFSKWIRTVWALAIMDK